MMEQREQAEFYERMCQKPPGSFRCVYDGVPIFEVNYPRDEMWDHDSLAHQSRIGPIG